VRVKCLGVAFDPAGAVLSHAEAVIRKIATAMAISDSRIFIVSRCRNLGPFQRRHLPRQCSTRNESISAEPAPKAVGTEMR
jgi:hypothetical protein